MINASPIYLSHEDHAKLRLLLAASAPAPGSSRLHSLRQELDRAIVVDAALIPTDVVTLESRVEYEDLESGEVAEYLITLPERANVDEHRISILAPIGTALIGYRAGDTVRWITPGGTRALKIRRVLRGQADDGAMVSLAPAGTSGR